MTQSVANSIGEHLRSWRERHRLSQLHCALEANISQRHLSFLETGRSRPSRDMVIHLATRLNVPLRERNAALFAAGFAPAYSERTLDDPDMATAQAALRMILKGHDPFPALAMDRHWHLIEANAAIAPLLAGVHPDLLVPPVNVLRLNLHPNGLAPRIENLGEWRMHLLQRLDRQIAATLDEVLFRLQAELVTYPGDQAKGDDRDHGGPASVAVPILLRTAAGTLSFISTTTVFGTPRDVFLSELAVEAFFPADPETAQALAGARI